MGVILLGVYNDQSIIPHSSTERIVMYREKFAGMYSSWPYSFAQVRYTNHKFVSTVQSTWKELILKYLYLLQAAIEIPYVFIQVLLYTLITYPTIGYYWTAQKFLWFLYAYFCSALLYAYAGLLLVSLTPNVQVATILAAFFNALQNLFSGFIIPAPVSIDLLLCAQQVM
jgi:hypothetical protein